MDLIDLMDTANRARCCKSIILSIKSHKLRFKKNYPEKSIKSINPGS
jgi:hypothetical protein